MLALIDAEFWVDIEGYEGLYQASKLKEHEVLEIKHLIQTTPLHVNEIGRMYNVSGHAVYKIKIGANWSWLTGFDKEDTRYVSSY